MPRTALTLRRLALLPLAGTLVAAAPADRTPDYGARLERFAYPWPVRMMPLTVIGEAAEMAYMDVLPERPNGRVVVLLHGKNFCGATWEGTARPLAAAGYRVVIPDQLGFCKSSKPRAAQYSFEALASNTDKLFKSLGITHATIIGHSMGGMLAMRYAILFPAAVDRLVLVNPLGLKDRSKEGLPYTDVDTLWAGERRTSAASIKAYQIENYYHGQWRAAYDRWVAMQAGMYAGTGRDQVALAQAKTSEMIKTQPVAHELYRIKAPTTIIIGTLDKTAFGRAQMPPSLRSFLQAIPQIAPEAARKIPRARVVKLDGLGHAPQVEDAARFNRTLMGVLNEATGS
jgi:pimeloyl-ACP methyl ester carboxylesterase